MVICFCLFVCFFVNITILVCLFIFFLFYIFHVYQDAFFSQILCAYAFNFHCCHFFQMATFSFYIHTYIIIFFAFLFIYFCRCYNYNFFEKTKYIVIRSGINKNVIKSLRYLWWLQFSLVEIEKYYNQTKSINEHCSMMSNGLTSID
jgi:hypothetical protein